MYAKHLLSVLLLSLLCIGVQAQGIYRHVDKDGNVTFSDKPADGGEPVQLSPTNTTPPPDMSGAATASTEVSEQDEGRYADVWIAVPQYDEAVRSNNGDLTVSVRVDPRLMVGDRVRLLMDGVAAAADSDSGQFQLLNLDRGTHELQAQIIDRANDVVLSSEAITVHILRVQAPRKAPR